VVVNNQTAIIYPMILPDRIALIVSVVSPTEPGQKADQKAGLKVDSKAPLEAQTRLYTQTIDQSTVAKTVNELQAGLRNRISLEFQPPSQQLYDWLIKPILPQLQAQKVETLVFVLDGVLRNIPMAALSDGQQFLVEQYSIATTLGLKLTTPKALQNQTLSGVGFGLTEARKVGNQDFSELPFVATELQDLQREISPSTVTLNQNFTRAQFQAILQKSVSPIVHLATHGQFSSNLEQTFLVASDGPIDTFALETALGKDNAVRATPIELLVLSACETAIGDDRAPLGLAGIALKSGARSTVASLWKVNDNATSQLMQKFYQAVAKRQVSKAVALQQAQRAILDDAQFRRHPYYWAPFILVGNWL
jgi:CHAT domain-containing protein